MCGNYKIALLVLNTCLNSIRSSSDDKYEQSEILMYKAMLLDELGDLNEALTFLDTFSEKITDRLAWLEQRTSILLRLHHFDKAERAAYDLLKINPENYEYHRLLQASVLGVPDLKDMKGCEVPAQFRYVGFL